MRELRSVIDGATTYQRDDNQITVSRGGDSLQISFENLEDVIRIFRSDIQKEIKAIRDKQHRGICPQCENFFVSDRKRIYCSNECCRKADQEKSKQRQKERKKPIKDKPAKPEPQSSLTEICIQAKKMGLTYGQYQAMKYKESLGWKV